jgi:hypothetical protein
MASVRKEVRPDRLPRAAPPIKYLTENGFSIVRLSETDPSVKDFPGDCRFLVSRDDGHERLIQVRFDDDLVTSLRLRRRVPLSESSLFWLVCAESCLARYLWEQDAFPPDARLRISDLSPDELMLALHWRDRDEYADE